MATNPATMSAERVLLLPQTYLDLVNRLTTLHRERKLGELTHDDLLLIMWGLAGYTHELLKLKQAGK
jgi:hypothetical protein